MATHDGQTLGAPLYRFSTEPPGSLRTFFENVGRGRPTTSAEIARNRFKNNDLNGLEEEPALKSSSSQSLFRIWTL
jgi:hypothetical protein